MSTCPRTAGAVLPPFATETLGFPLSQASRLTGKTFESVRLVANWVRTYLAAPHAELGRTGPVCPFTPEAINRDSLWIKPVRISTNAEQVIEDAVLAGKAAFSRCPVSTRADDFIFRSLMFVFPDISAQDAPRLIDQVKEKLKPIFVDDGLMLGEFHENNSMPGLHNENFHPLRSPVPMLVIRHMVPSDLVFLNRPDDPRDRRLRYLQAYLTHQTAISSSERRRIDSIVSELRAATSDSAA